MRNDPSSQNSLTLYVRDGLGVLQTDVVPGIAVAPGDTYSAEFFATSVSHQVRIFSTGVSGTVLRLAGVSVKQVMVPG